MPASVNQLARATPDALRRLGLSGGVLLAAVLADLVIVVSAATDRAGPRWVDLLLLPGILGTGACALWGRRRPLTAAFTAAGVLVAATVLAAVTVVEPYSVVLSNISFAETVAGVELVYLCARGARPWPAFAATVTLVTAGLVAAAGRSDVLNGTDATRTLLFGLVLLIGAVGFGVQLRDRPARSGVLTELLRGEWPLIGLLSLPLFGELYQALETTARAMPVLLCSAGSAVLAVLATRYPVRAGYALAAVMLASTGLAVLVDLPATYLPGSGTPITQVAAGIAVVVSLVRYTEWARAWRVIGALSAVVAAATVVSFRQDGRALDLNVLSVLFLAALLLLAVAVATGMYFRSRDAARGQAMRSAVTEAKTSERMALARELHDVVAHHVTGIVVQAQAAKLGATQDPALTRDALDRIEQAGTEALTAMRRLVRSMRGDAPAGTSELSEQATTDLAADLHRLVEGAPGGVRTKTSIDLPRQLPQELARSALRLVQESLTNIGKHARDARLATVSAEIVGGELHLRVSDDGRGDHREPAGGTGGYGLVGMRERVGLLGGRLRAGPRDEGGWLVEAWLPVEGAE